MEVTSKSIHDDQHNVTYFITDAHIRLVDGCLRYLVKQAASPTNEVYAWLSRHSVAIYLPLDSFFERLKILKLDPNIEPNDPVLWKAFYEHLSYNMRPLNIEEKGLTTCHLCKVQIKSQAHFNELCHVRRVMVQSFRFSALGKPIWEHQDWMKNHRLAVGRPLRRVPGDHGDVIIRFEGVTNGTAIAVGGSRWRIGPDGVTVIKGDSASGSLASLQFSVTNRTYVEVTVYASRLTDNPFETLFIPVADQVYPGQRMMVSLELLPERYLGFKYYEVQFWVAYISTSRQEKFVAFSAIIQWEFTDKELKKRIDKALEYTPEKTKRSIGSDGLGRKPDCTSKPNPFMDGPESNRICKPVPISHRCLAPYFAVWQQGNHNQPWCNNRRFQHSLPVYPAITAPQQVLQFLNLQDPITVDTLPMRLLAELVGQAEYEQNDPVSVELEHLRTSVNSDFASLDHQEGNTIDYGDCFFLSAIVSTKQLEYVGLKSPLARAIHREWQYKYIVFIEGRKQLNESQTMLILKLNNGTRRAFMDPSGQILDRCRGLQLTAMMGPAVEYQIALLLKIIHHQHKYPNLLADEKADRPRVELMEDDEDSDDSVFLYSDEHADVARIPKRTKRAAAGVQDSEDSRREKFNEFFMKNWRAFVEVYFCGKTLVDPKTSWKQETAQSKEIAWMDEDQKRITNAVISGMPLVLCKAPPGTGKTTCVAQLLAVLNLEQPEQRFLCVTATNAAANVLADRLVQCYKDITGEPPSDSTAVRYLKKGYDFSTLSENTAQIAASRGATPDGRTEIATTSALLRYRIIICTLDMAIMDIANTLDAFHHDPDHEHYGKGIFDLVVVDEAATVDLPRLSVVLPLATHAQLLLLGDIHQLPAYVTNRVLQRYAAEESGMEFLLNIAASSPACRIIQLRRNYRSRKDLLFPPNAVVYTDSPLIHAADQSLYDSQHRESYVVPDGASIAFLHVEGEHRMHGCSLYNPHEIAAVHTIVRQLIVESGVDPSDIGINGTYAAQTDLIRSVVGSEFPVGKIACANNWQGDQSPYMIISLVRSQPEVDAFGQAHHLGFLQGLQRVNVSITRARKINIFVCNVLHFLDQPLIRECLRLCCLRQAWLPPVGAAVMQYVHLRVCKALPLNNDPSDPEQVLSHFVDLQKPHVEQH